MQISIPMTIALEDQNENTLYIRADYDPATRQISGVLNGQCLLGTLDTIRDSCTLSVETAVKMLGGSILFKRHALPPAVSDRLDELADIEAEKLLTSGYRMLKSAVLAGYR